MKLIFITLTLLVCFGCVFGQTNLTGTVFDQRTQKKLSGVTLKIFNANDSTILQGVSDEEGSFAFNFKTHQHGEFAIVASLLGYSSKNIKIKVEPSKKQLGPIHILMEEGSISIDAIDIVSKAVAILNGDTTEFDASAFKTEPYADSDALIKQLPGTLVDEEGNLIVQGEQVTKILVDNKEFFTTDPRLALKNLPADIIDKIQIIDEKSEQSQFSGFDDGQRNKVINIVTKKDKRNGYFGKATTGLGNLQRYTGNGNVSLFSPKERFTVSAITNNVNQLNFSLNEMTINLPTGGRARSSGSRPSQNQGRSNTNPSGQPGNTVTHTIALNYNRSFLEEALKFSTDYNFNRTNSLVNTWTNRETLIGKNTNQFRIQESENDRINLSHRLASNINWKIDSIQQLTLKPSFRIQDITGMVLTTSSTTLANLEPQNKTNRNQSSNNFNFNFSGDIEYRIRLKKKGRTLSASLSTSLNSSTGDAQTYALNEYYNDFISTRTDTTNLKNQSETLGNGFNTRLAYTEPISNQQRFQINYSLRNNSNFSNRETLNWLAETGQFSELNEQLSNRFINDYMHHSGGFSYQFNQSKFNIDAGLDFQNSIQQNHKTFPEESFLKRDFLSFLPNAVISYRPSRDINTQFQYTTSTNAPSVQELQDVINNQNALNIRTGNPNLKQEYQHRFTLSYNRVNRQSGGNFNASLQAQFSNNKVVNSTYIAQEDTLIAPGVWLGKGGQFTKPMNLNGYYSIRNTMSWGAPIKALKINLNARSGMFLTHTIGLMNNQVTESEAYGLNQVIGFNSRLSEKLIFSANYTINYNVSNSSLLENTTYAYLNQNASVEFVYIFWKGIRVNTSFNFHQNQGLSQGYNQNFMLWNVALGKKMFKRQQGEISISAVDLLNRNINITRNITEMYITDISTNTLQQYFMLNFTYNLRHFGAGMGELGRSSKRTRL